MPISGHVLYDTEYLYSDLTGFTTSTQQTKENSMNIYYNKSA